MIVNSNDRKSYYIELRIQKEKKIRRKQSSNSFSSFPIGAIELSVCVLKRCLKVCFISCILLIASIQWKSPESCIKQQLITTRGKRERYFNKFPIVKRITRIKVLWLQMLHTSKNEKCLFDYHNLMRCIHIQFEADEKH